jgi:hypothetical protein
MDVEDFLSGDARNLSPALLNWAQFSVSAMGSLHPSGRKLRRRDLMREGARLYVRQLERKSEPRKEKR